MKGSKGSMTIRSVVTTGLRQKGHLVLVLRPDVSIQWLRHVWHSKCPHGSMRTLQAGSSATVTGIYQHGTDLLRLLLQILQSSNVLSISQ